MTKTVAYKDIWISQGLFTGTVSAVATQQNASICFKHTDGEIYAKIWKDVRHPIVPKRADFIREAKRMLRAGEVSKKYAA